MAGEEDLFTPIHKGLRSMMYNLSSRLQTNDFANLAETRALVADLEHDFEVARSAGCMVCVFHHHAQDEESAIFPDAAKFQGSLISSLIDEHRGLTRRELEIARSAHQLLDLTDVGQRIEAGIKLNQSANELLAAYISHMNREETELVPVMRQHFTDEQQAAMRGLIMGRMVPERLFGILGWMLPSLNVTELTDLVVSVKETAPPPFFDAVAKLCVARVDPARWGAVKSRVGL
jgi:hypothetical protein